MLSPVRIVLNIVFPLLICLVCYVILILSLLTISLFNVLLRYYLNAGCAKWFQLLLDDRNPLQVLVEDQQRMLHFTILLVEQMWLIRNERRNGKSNQENWEEFADRINRLLAAYWDAAIIRLNKRKKRHL